jgi:hypothetical protein
LHCYYCDTLENFHPLTYPQHSDAHHLYPEGLCTEAWEAICTRYLSLHIRVDYMRPNRYSVKGRGLDPMADMSADLKNTVMTGQSKRVP